jgi:hypothetical protein
VLISFVLIVWMEAIAHQGRVRTMSALSVGRMPIAKMESIALKNLASNALKMRTVKSTRLALITIVSLLGVKMLQLYPDT